MVNRREGLLGQQGIGYDYVLAANGLWVQARSPSLVARVPVAPAVVRGLRPVDFKLELSGGPLPAHLLNEGLRWFMESPGQERFFAICRDGDGYAIRVPGQSGSVASLSYEPVDEAVAEFHSHGRLPAFFSGADDRDEQRFRVYGVVGRLDAVPEMVLRVGVYGHYAPLSLRELFDGPCLL